MLNEQLTKCRSIQWEQVDVVAKKDQLCESKHDPDKEEE